MNKKKCFKCGELKPLKDFYIHAEMADGHLNKCKRCTKNDVRLFRIEHPERLKIYERTRNRSKISAIRTKEWRKKYPERYKAQNMLNNAIRDGKIIKQKKCEICGSDSHIHAHHNDYSKPLEIVWLCAKCHGQIQ